MERIQNRELTGVLRIAFDGEKFINPSRRLIGCSHPVEGNGYFCTYSNKLTAGGCQVTHGGKILKNGMMFNICGIATKIMCLWWIDRRIIINDENIDISQ